MSVASKAKWVEALAQALWGYHHMGLVPSRVEDVPADWEELSPEQRRRWEHYAAQVRHAVELVQLGERGGEFGREGRSVTAVGSGGYGGNSNAGFTGTTGVCGGVGAGGAGYGGGSGGGIGSEFLFASTAFGPGGGGVGYLKSECTGPAASWCPIHGTCSCPRNSGGERIEQSDDCPLHGRGSLHAE